LVEVLVPFQKKVGAANVTQWENACLACALQKKKSLYTCTQLWSCKLAQSFWKVQ
jgi:PIN domain nuclease of toxin-antitoxin system